MVCIYGIIYILCICTLICNSDIPRWIYAKTEDAKAGWYKSILPPARSEKGAVYALQVRSAPIMASVAPRHHPSSVPSIRFPSFASLSSPNS